MYSISSNHSRNFFKNDFYAFACVTHMMLVKDEVLAKHCLQQKCVFNTNAMNKRYARLLKKLIVLQTQAHLLIICKCWELLSNSTDYFGNDGRVMAEQLAPMSGSNDKNHRHVNTIAVITNKPDNWQASNISQLQHPMRMIKHLPLYIEEGQYRKGHPECN